MTFIIHLIMKSVHLIKVHIIIPEINKLKAESPKLFICKFKPNSIQKIMKSRYSARHSKIFLQLSVFLILSIVCLFLFVLRLQYIYLLIIRFIIYNIHLEPVYTIIPEINKLKAESSKVFMCKFNPNSIHKIRKNE